MIIMKAYSDLIIHIMTALISHHFKVCKTFANKLLSDKLNHTTAVIFIGMLIIFQFYLYADDLNEYFSVFEIFAS